MVIISVKIHQDDYDINYNNLVFYCCSFLLVAFEAYRNTDDALNYVASGGMF